MWIINDINPAEPEGREFLPGMGLCPALVWGGTQAPPAWCPRGGGCLAGLESHPIPHPCAGQAGQGHPGWPWWLRDLCGFVATTGPGQVFLPRLLLCSTPSSGVLARIIPWEWLPNSLRRVAAASLGLKEPMGTGSPKDTWMGSTARPSFSQA